MDTAQNTDSDFQLLRRFTRGDEAAFAGLVERHAAMVRGVALRCTEDAGLAEEVSQSVFVLLARRASSIPSEHLSGWLHNTAFLTARNARRNSLRYRQALRELGHHPDIMNPSERSSGFAASPWEDIRPHLDEAVYGLPENARRPVMLRFFENKSVREIAALTGKNEAAVRKGIERSLERLSGMLRRRGIMTTGAALGAMLSGQSLLAPSASAALTVAALQGISPVTAVAASSSATVTLLSKTIILMTTYQGLTTAAATLVLASIPAAFLWRENSGLKQELRELKAVAVSVAPSAPGPLPQKGTDPAGGGVSAKPKTAEPPAASSAEPGAAALAALFSPESILKRAEEDAAKNAMKEMERISLYLPELTEERKEQVRAALEGDSKVKLARFKTALESGAFDRVMNHPETATKEDRALMAAAAPPGLPSRENDALISVLTPEQFETYWQKREERRVGEAEEKATDALKILNMGMDLSAEQKDLIFDGLAKVQLAPVEGGDGSSNAFLDQKLREAENERVIRENLTPEQTVLFEKRIAEIKTGIETILKAAKPAQGQE
jgi:RNA polymerase sigma factor (sigma-70 family)